MGLRPGERIAHYEVLDLLGAGGMGEVYRARDTKLDREVALKVLPSTVTADRERLARFQREARLLASLNHPNIAAIHGIEEAPGEAGAEPSRALVLELVEGATLADRVLRGPLPVPEALAIARQIAEALDAAHERGIVHRDLKPANVKVTPAGAVKVLDFGIAKSVAAEMPTAQMSAAETVGTTVAATRDGAVLGTVPYMSPEQARGQPVDKRTDIWAFGCVLFEMLTGRSPFQGDTVSDTIVRVLDRQPDWDSLPGETPPRVRELLRRCLDKDPQCRYRDIGDARLDLAEESGIFAADPGTAAAPAAADRGPAAPGRRRRAVAAAVAGGVLLAVVAGLWWWQGRSGEPEPIDSVVVLRFESDAGDEPGEYLGEGITENLINKLSGLPGLRVVPRGIAAGYSSADLDLERLADELDVRAVVTGRVAEREGTLVVRAELTDLASVSQIWGQQYTRPLTDILSLEEELVRQISSELRLRLSPDDETRLARRDTDNPEAYRLFLRARHHVLSLSPEGLDLGLEYAHRAVAADPAYGLGHAVLADAYVARTFVGLEPHEEGFRRARAAAERALELDRTHAYPRLVNGFVLHHGEWDWEGAVRHWQAALELEPESADAHQSYSEGMASLGRLDEALEHARRAVELDPNFGNQSNWLAHVLVMLERYEEAHAANETALELTPGHGVARMRRPYLLQILGREAEAEAELERVIREAGGDPDRDPAMAELHGHAGRLDEAREVLARIDLEAVAAGRLVALARAQAFVGDADAAFATLDRAIAARHSSVLWFPYNPQNRVFQGDPRYDRLVRGMGFSAASG